MPLRDDQIPDANPLGASQDMRQSSAALNSPVSENLGPGTLVDGRYAIFREIGRGGMGCVFAARDTKLRRGVAIKVLNASPNEPHQLLRLSKEARTAGGLAHPNIVAIHDEGDFAGRAYLVEELLRGKTLAEQLRAGVLPRERALDLAVQAARGLAAAHDQGVVHGDIKPDNLFVTTDGWLKILDFGIATLRPPPGIPRTVTNPSGAASVAGTPGYMSPEQIQGMPTDARSDLFSLGVVLYEMLAGRRAFERGTPVETAWAILHEEPPPIPADVPQPLARIVLRCLEKDVGSRFQSAQDLAFNLETLRRGGAWNQSLRRGLLFVFGAALILTVLAAVVLLYRPSRPQPEFRQLTFHRGVVWSARFGPDGQTVYYAVTTDASPPRLYLTSATRPEAQRLDVAAANLLAVSSKGELAVLLRPRIDKYAYDVGTLARFFPAGGAPRELMDDVEAADWTPDGSQLAVVRTADSRSRLEYPPGRVLFQTTGWVSHPRFSPDGRRIAFLHHPALVDDAGTVMICDLDGSARTLTGAWRSAQGLAWAKGGTEVWFTAAANGAAGNVILRAVDLSARERVLAQVAGQLQLHDVAPDGRALLTEPSRRLGLTVLRVGERKTIDLSWFDVTFLGDLSADGREVLFTVAGPASGSGSMVYLRKTDGSPAVRLGEGYGLAISPDGRWALSLSRASGGLQPLTLLPTGAGEVRSLEPGGLIAARARWFPDGKRLLIAGQEQGHGMRLYVRELDASNPRPISGEGVSSAWLAISRDGALVADLDAAGRTMLYPVDGGDPVPLPELQTGEVPFGFAEDGSLFVGRTRAMTVPVYRFDVRTRRRTLVATLAADVPGALGVLLVQAAPDGATLAFNQASVTTHLHLLGSSQ